MVVHGGKPFWFFFFCLLLFLSIAFSYIRALTSTVSYVTQEMTYEFFEMWGPPLGGYILPHQ